ncbi:MAG: hydroxymethylbilane synthase, partial [Chloroflexi bacterium]|nr:hydroxymethylbilane synthase [Chloroflexota bacterium]
MKARIATRRSPLARAQAALVADLVQAANPGLGVEFVLVDTSGDLDRSRPIETLGERGVFSRGVQAALLDGRADIAVHSYKDLPTEPLAGLRIAAVPVRADPRDALVSLGGEGLAELPEGARIGTGSARRSAQVLAARPD